MYSYQDDSFNNWAISINVHPEEQFNGGKMELIWLTTESNASFDTELLQHLIMALLTVIPVIKYKIHKMQII
jgi:hypothetical protein